ncbi:MAG: TonB-dependent receptor [Gammaproteobacteria bacterium]|nr:TonB-dependent receptor [Gammaproteobacteria bacterium]
MVFPFSRRLALAAAIGAACAGAAHAEDTQDVVVTATRVKQEELRIPMAVTVVDGATIQHNQQLGLDESLNRVPGVFFNDRYNFAQDLRVSIRGFGARANFGIRGIKIYVDGIPSTMPDGQGGVDDIDLASVGRVEVIRGPASSLYGSAAGGVINITTEDGTKQPFVEGGVSRGEYGFGKYNLKAGGEIGQLNYLVSGNYVNLDGYRDHAGVQQANMNSKFNYAFADGSDLTAVVSFVHSPKADDPGGLTAAQAAADPRQAKFGNLRYDTGEALDQQKFGLVYNRDLAEHHHVTVRNYYIWREFGSKLGFGVPQVPSDGIVDFSRFVTGGGAQYIYDGRIFGHANVFTLGVDVDTQKDYRQRYKNLRGKTGALTFNELETADTVGAFFRDQFSITEHVDFVAGGRYDVVSLHVGDRFLANGDQTSTLDFDEFSPTVGLIYSPFQALNLYTNIATAFETPTFTELANPARNGTAGGFANVSPQKTTSYEVGVKGLVFKHTRYDVAFYHADVSDEITNTANLSGRTFFQNADTTRNGLEASLVTRLAAGLDLTMSYNFAHYRFEKFMTTPAAEGLALPGLPEHQFFTELAYRHDSGFFAKVNVLFVDSYAANNLNTVMTDPYAVSNLMVGWDLKMHQLTVTPYVGVNNMFDESYFQNVILNAAGAAYYEPAPEENAFGGLTVRYTFGT